MLNRFVQYCRNHLNLNDSLYAEPYHSFSVVLIDCFYSLRTHYFSVTVPIVKRYAEIFMNGDVFAYGDNLCSFINHIDNIGGCEAFACEILKNKQVIAGRLKSEICFELAEKLMSLGIETINDFQQYQDLRKLETTLRSVRGVGDAGLNYLFMLAGDPNRCKPDVHVHRCIKEACGKDISNQECQLLFTSAVSVLKTDYPRLNVRLLDGIIWKEFQSRKTNKKHK